MDRSRGIQTYYENMVSPLLCSIVTPIDIFENI
jgi:hypothetical protein